MNLLKKNTIKFIFFLGQYTLLGRGKLRKFLITLLNNFILNSIDKKTLDPRFQCSINSIPFNFYSDEKTGKKFYFGRNENEEINFVKSKIHNNFIFVDIGANMGLYTMNVANELNKYPNAKIVSIEPNLINFKRLKQNLKILLKKIPRIFHQVNLENCSIGNTNSSIRLYIGHDHAVSSHNNSFKNQEYVKIKQKKLITIVKKNKIKNITIVKIDIEGYEDRALINYFKSVKKSLFPEHIIIEHSNKKLWKEDVINNLVQIGYSKNWSNHNNTILSINK